MPAIRNVRCGFSACPRYEITLLTIGFFALG
jgi:hypothetical protein